MRGIQTYRRDVQIYRGHPNIWGSQMYGGIWTPPYSDKACFLWVVYVQGTSKHMGAYIPCCMFGCPYMFGYHQYVWTPLICLDILCVFAHPLYLDASYMFGHTLYVWMPPYGMMTPYILKCAICLDGVHTFGCPHTFEGHPNI